MTLIDVSVEMDSVSKRAGNVTMQLIVINLTSVVEEIVDVPKVSLQTDRMFIEAAGTRLSNFNIESNNIFIGCLFVCSFTPLKT